MLVYLIGFFAVCMVYVWYNLSRARRGARLGKEHKISFHPYEDDYIDLHLDLAENLPKLLLMAENADDYKDRTFHLPEGMQPWHLDDVPLSHRGIRVGELEEVLLRHGMKQVKDPWEGSREYARPYLLVYACHGHYLYAEHGGNVVQNCWLSSLQAQAYASAADLLYEIGSRYNLVIYWEGKGLLIDLSNQEHIQRYVVGA